MAAREWRGGTSGVFNLDANWFPATVPVSGDDIIFNEDGNVAMDGSDQGAIDLNSFTIGEGYTKDIGSTGTALTIGSSRLVHRGKGTLYHRNDGAEVVDEFIVAFTGEPSKTAAAIARGYSRVVISNGFVSQTNMAGSIAELIVDGAQSEFLFSANLFTITKAWISNNSLVTISDLQTSLSSLATAFISDAKLIYEGLSIFGSTTLHISKNGLVEWNSAVLLGVVNIYDGLLDLTKTTQKKTVTTVNVWPDGKIKYDVNLTTFTNPINEFDGRTTDIG